MNVLDIILVEKTSVDEYWKHASLQGRPVTVDSRLNKYSGYSWRGYFFYKQKDQTVKAVPMKSIRGKIVPGT